MNYQLLIVDLTACSLLVVDGVTNIIIAELPLPAGEAITAIHVSADGEKVYLPAAGNAGKGSLYIFNRLTLSLYRLPVAIAHPAWFTLYGSLACFADPAGRLYILDTVTLRLKECQPPLPDGRCAGLTATAGAVVSLWEQDTVNLAAVMDLSGEWTAQISLPGLPTSLTADLNGHTYAACAIADNTMQMICITTTKDDSPPALAMLRCPVCREILPGYPAALAVDRHALYVMTEESTLTVIDKVTGQTVSHSILGRPLDSLHLLPDGRQAIGHSLLRGNLALIDLEGGRIVAMTATDHRLGPVAVFSQIKTA